ncbi:MAG: class I SAM-dependent RNA methyltransferase [Hyphomicrobiaceae bacterium]
MTAASTSRFEIFLVTAPGLEAVLAAEARERGFRDVMAIKGGVTVSGGWPEVWRANLDLRGAARVLARLGSFRAHHLAQLDKRARKIAWSQVLRGDVPFAVEATCRSSRIYHSGAAAERIARAIEETLGTKGSKDADVVVKARIEDDLVTLAVDTTGDPLHRRGHKEAVAKAPMRENLAAMFLRLSGYDGHEPVLDPMCGSGTFVIEAAEIAAGLKPGRSRHFAFERLATFDERAWSAMRGLPEAADTLLRFHGSDRDGGAVAMARANATRAGVGHLTQFAQLDASQIVPPPGPAGLVIVNPPYGARIGEKQRLGVLYRALGERLKTRFAGWRVGVITSDAQLARATGLPFEKPHPPVDNGGISVTLYATGALP